MKKFTFLLSLLLAFVGLTASAQDVRTWKKLANTPSVDNAVTEISQLKDGGTYAFYSTSYKSTSRLTITPIFTLVTFLLCLLMTTKQA